VELKNSCANADLFPEVFETCRFQNKLVETLNKMVNCFSLPQMSKSFGSNTNRGITNAMVEMLQNENQRVHRCQGMPNTMKIRA
jgi:hypothetical protein